MMSLSSMWRIEGNPPWVQISACSTVKCKPQMREMVDGKVASHIVSKGHLGMHLNLWRANPVLATGRVASHLDAPFSDATCIVLFTLLASFSSSCVASEIDIHYRSKYKRSKIVGKYNL